MKKLMIVLFAFFALALTGCFSSPTNPLGPSISPTPTHIEPTPQPTRTPRWNRTPADDGRMHVN
jgi:starvation-inducible outer membrane lipoprotein